MEPFVSQAANFEDVMLWRALKHVTNGFFIDVGAHMPVGGSVTWAFSQRGWRGINVEPDPDLFARFPEQRPRDVNLNLAVGAEPGDLEMSFFPDRPAVSTLDETEAEARRQDGYAVVRRRVQVRTLAGIWDDHVPEGEPVHFLNVDVEGYEREVLAGADWGRHRPWVVLVEATRPTTQVPSHEAWEPALLAAGYSFAYQDGVNRFYVSDEHAELVPAFAAPPNVFDGFVRASELRAQEHAQHAIDAAARARTELRTMRGSISWRVTKPLRLFSRFARGAGPPPRS